MATNSRTISTRSANRTVLFDIEEDNVPMNSTMRSNRTTSSTVSSRSRAATTSSNRSHSRRKAGENHRAKSVETADFRGTNPIMDGEGPDDGQAERIPTLDDRGHVNFSNSRYRKAVDTAKRSARARGALPAGSARSRDPFNPISPTRTTRTQTVDIQEDDEEDQAEYDVQKYDCRRQFQHQEAERVQGPSRVRSRKQSISTWSYCGHSYPNAFLRLCTAVVIVPLVVCGLIFWPVLAAAVLTTVLLCVCCYEHAWLSFRIHSQLLATYQWYEGNEGPTDEGDAIGASTRSDVSAVCGYHDGGRSRFHSSFASGFTQSTTSFPTDTVLGSDDGNMSFLTTNDKDSFADPVAEAEATMQPKAPSAVYLLELETSRGVLLGMANLLFCGNLWLARVVVAALFTTCWSVAATMALPMIPFPVASTPSDIATAPYYFWVINFVAALCAASCPTWPRAISLIVQKSAFEVLLLNALNCPLAASVDCSAAPITSLQAFVLGAMVIVLVHALSAHGPASLVVALAMDLLGYAYIAGALGLMIMMVDPSDPKATWATIWLGMLSAMWVAQLAGYVCDTIMHRFQLPHMRLLPPRIVVTLDVEASLCAIAAGSLVLVFGGAVLNVPGGVVPKVLFSVASVLTARFGRLVISLLKKASGVRWSGRLMPGFGGALDGSHALLFTSIVFVKYYLYVMARQTSVTDSSSGSGDSAVWATVTFSTDLRS